MKPKNKKEFNQRVNGWVTKFAHYYLKYTSGWWKWNWDRCEKEYFVINTIDLQVEARFLNEVISYQDSKPEHALIRDFQAWADYYNLFNLHPRDINKKLLKITKEHPVKLGFYL